MTARLLRIVGVVLIATCLALGSGLVGPALGTGPTTATGPSTVTGSIASTGATPFTESVTPISTTPSPSVIDADQVTRSVPVIATDARADRITRDRSRRGERSSRQGMLPEPFAQADDDDDNDDDEEGTRIINITAPGDNVEYTLVAPDLEPTDSVEVGENAEDAANPETVRGDTASGTIGNGAYDAYRFTGSIDAVRLESDDIDELEVTVDGESVDPRTLVAEEDAEATTAETTTEAMTDETATEATTDETATEATTDETATEATTDETATEATTDETATDRDTTITERPATTTESTDTDTTDTAATTTDTAGAESGQSGFGIVMFVLIGVVSGMMLAGALAYVVGSDRFG